MPTYNLFINGEENWEVQEILASRIDKALKTKVVEYLILWSGFPEQEATWEPYENLQGTAEETLQTFHQKNPLIDLLATKDQPTCKPHACSLLINGEENWEVQRILASRKGKDLGTRAIEYLILWSGFPEQEATWEPYENLQGTAEETLRMFHLKNPFADRDPRFTFHYAPKVNFDIVGG